MKIGRRGTAEGETGSSTAGGRSATKSEAESAAPEPSCTHSGHLTISYVAMVQCLRCRVRLPIEVNAEDLKRLRAFERLRRICAQCQGETEWQYLPLGVSR